jgi:hypothetical protein
MAKYFNLLLAVFLFSTELPAADNASKHMTVKHQKFFTGEATQLEAQFVGQRVRIRDYYVDFEAHLGQLLGEPTITSHFKFSFTDKTEIIVGDGAEQVVLRSGWSVGQDGKGYIIPKEQWKKIRITGASYVANIDSHHSIIAQTPGLMGRNGEWSQDIPGSPTWGTLLYSPNFTQSSLWMNKAEPDYQHLLKTWKHAAAEEVKKFVSGNFGETVNSGLYLFDVWLDLWPTVPVMERNYPAYLGDLLGTKQYKDPINRQAQAMVNQANYYADSSNFSKRAQVTDKWFKQFGNRVDQKIKDEWLRAKSRPQELQAEAALSELMSSIDKMGNVEEIPKPLLIKLQATAKKVEAVPSSSHVHVMLAKAKGLLGKEPKKQKKIVKDKEIKNDGKIYLYVSIPGDLIIKDWKKFQSSMNGDMKYAISVWREYVKIQYNRLKKYSQLNDEDVIKSLRDDDLFDAKSSHSSIRMTLEPVAVKKRPKEGWDSQWFYTGIESDLERRLKPYHYSYSNTAHPDSRIYNAQYNKFAESGNFKYWNARVSFDGHMRDTIVRLGSKIEAFEYYRKYYQSGNTLTDEILEHYNNQVRKYMEPGMGNHMTEANYDSR